MKEQKQIFKLRKYPIFISGMVAGLSLLILIIDFWYNGFTEQALKPVYFIGAMILISGFSVILTVQYLFQDWNKRIVVNSTEMFTIQLKNREVKIKKSELREIILVENNWHRTLGYYKYLRMKTTNETFIITSFIIEPLEFINRLEIEKKYKTESVFVPLIRFDIQSESTKAKKREDFKRKKLEFLEIYRNYEISKLKKITADRNGYADYAIEAAKEILEMKKSKK